MPCVWLPCKLLKICMLLLVTRPPFSVFLPFEHFLNHAWFFKFLILKLSPSSSSLRLHFIPTIITPHASSIVISGSDGCCTYKAFILPLSPTLYTLFALFWEAKSWKMTISSASHEGPVEFLISSLYKEYPL